MINSVKGSESLDTFENYLLLAYGHVVVLCYKIILINIPPPPLKKRKISGGFETRVGAYRHKFQRQLLLLPSVTSFRKVA